MMMMMMMMSERERGGCPPSLSPTTPPSSLAPPSPSSALRRLRRQRPHRVQARARVLPRHHRQRPLEESSAARAVHGGPVCAVSERAKGGGGTGVFFVCVSPCVHTPPPPASPAPPPPTPGPWPAASRAKTRLAFPGGAASAPVPMLFCLCVRGVWRCPPTAAAPTAAAALRVVRTPPHTHATHKQYPLAWPNLNQRRAAVLELLALAALALSLRALQRLLSCFGRRIAAPAQADLAGGARAAGEHFLAVCLAWRRSSARTGVHEASARVCALGLDGVFFSNVLCVPAGYITTI